MPFDVTIRGARIPLPTLIAAVLTALAWLSVIVYHDTARWVGAGWMIFGLVGYAIYRKGIEGTTLTERVEVPAEALVKDTFGRRSTATSSSRSSGPSSTTTSSGPRVGSPTPPTRPGETAPKLEVIYVVDLPLTVPLDSPPPADRAEAANRALERAKEVGEEYDTVEVHLSVVRARSVGAGIVAGGARPRRRDDRDGRRAADADQGRRGARRDRGLAARRRSGR